MLAVLGLPTLVRFITIPLCNSSNLNSCSLEKGGGASDSQLSTLQTDEVEGGQVDCSQHVREGFIVQQDSGAEPQIFGLCPRLSSSSPMIAFIWAWQAHGNQDKPHGNWEKDLVSRMVRDSVLNTEAAMHLISCSFKKLAQCSWDFIDELNYKYFK